MSCGAKEPKKPARHPSSVTTDAPGAPGGKSRPITARETTASTSATQEKHDEEPASTEAVPASQGESDACGCARVFQRMFSRRNVYARLTDESNAPASARAPKAEPAGEEVKVPAGPADRARALRKATDDEALGLLQGTDTLKRTTAALKEQLDACTEAVNVIGMFLGAPKEVLDVPGDAGARMNGFDGFIKDLEKRGNVFCRCVNVRKSHEWTVIKVDGKYDLYESDANDPSRPIHLLGYNEKKDRGQTKRDMDVVALRKQLDGMEDRIRTFGIQFSVLYHPLDAPAAK